MPDSNDQPRYDERFEPLSLALGHLVIVAGILELALLTDVIARRAARDGARATFEGRLLSELENKSAGVLVGRLRSLGYEPDLAARLDAAIAERNRLVHHLLEEPAMMRALGGADPAELCARVEELVGEMYALVAELEPSISAGMEGVFDRSAAQLHALLGEVDPAELEEGLEREQFEALRNLPTGLLDD
jgi:hypothetical protein